MRTFWLLLLTVALAWGLWSLLGSEDEWTPDQLPADTEALPTTTEPQAPPGTGVLLTTGVLTVTVRTSEGALPLDAQAGYLRGAGERVKRCDEKGQVRFSDAPLGELVVVAHAPAFRDATQRCYLSAGLPTDVVLVLEPEQGD